MLNAYTLPDHPVVACMERTGYPPWIKDREYTCPVCGAECETIYTDPMRQPVGCDVCLEAKDAYEYYDEQEE